MKNLSHILFISLMVGVGTLFHIPFFVEGFIITISIVILHAFIYFYPDVNPIPMNLMIAIISPAIRLVSLLIDHQPLGIAISMVAPDIMFYVSFGIINFWLYYRHKQKDLAYFAVIAVVCDISSNIVELSFRMPISEIGTEMLRTLLLIAIARSMIACTFILIFKSYKHFLDRDAQDVRYSQLMLMSSHFQSEIYYLKKNMIQIEDTMKKSYQAYKLSESLACHSDFQAITLEIAKDIHEIKKDYVHVIKGLEGFMGEELRQDVISLKDIFKILEINTLETLKAEGRSINAKFICYENIHIKDHSYLMSILKNLIHNAIDALESAPNPLLRVSAYQFSGKESLVITVEDNGKGITEDEKPYIFNPGFSTKFNATTGDIYRGLGLSIVKNLVEDKFQGYLDVQSNPFNSTKMILHMPIMALEGEKQ